jgi:hypothetical protein
MTGDSRKRFCGECKLNVYNLSDMTRYDAENLLRLSEGRLCVRYFQRPDGTVLTQDCPVGWARVRRRLSLAATAAFGLFLSLLGTVGVMSAFGRKSVVMGEMIPYTTPTPDREPLMAPSPSHHPRRKRHPHQMGHGRSANAPPRRRSMRI